ncbi:MAG: hypothetical protein ACE5IK_07060 [Acidobacteriota bacterium]
MKAAFFGTAVPGAGHIYAGEPSRGLTFFLGAAVGLFLFIVPGVVIWLASICDAVLAARRRNASALPLDLVGRPSPVVFAAVAISDGPASPSVDSSSAPGLDLPRSTAP